MTGGSGGYALRCSKCTPREASTGSGTQDFEIDETINFDPLQHWGEVSERFVGTENGVWRSRWYWGVPALG